MLRFQLLDNRLFIKSILVPLNTVPDTSSKRIVLHKTIIPTRCFIVFFSAILIGPLVKLNVFFYTSIKTRAYEYLISALISQY